jgi:hypothetical protein
VNIFNMGAIKIVRTPSRAYTFAASLYVQTGSAGIKRRVHLLMVQDITPGIIPKIHRWVCLAPPPPQSCFKARRVMTIVPRERGELWRHRHTLPFMQRSTTPHNYLWPVPSDKQVSQPWAAWYRRATTTALHVSFAHGPDQCSLVWCSGKNLNHTW